MKNLFQKLAFLVVAWGLLAFAFSFQKASEAYRLPGSSRVLSASVAGANVFYAPADPSNPLPDSFLPPPVSAMTDGSGVAGSGDSGVSSGAVATPSNEVTCVFIQKSLSYKASDRGANGSVTALQRFLSQTGYLTATPNGSFGPATLRAVKAFQREQGISASGFVGPLTRQKIKDVSCSALGNPDSPAFPASPAIPVQGGPVGTTPVSPSNPSSPVPLPAPAPVPPVVASLWPSVGPAGTQVVMRGSGFTPSNNAVSFGSSYDPTLQNVSSNDGASLIFTVPADAKSSGSYPVTVTNANGKSNTQAFYVPIPWYDSGPQTPGFPVSNPPNPITASGPSISSLSTSAGPVGTTVTLYGSGFDSNNYVLFGSGGLRSTVASPDGRTLTFDIPFSIGSPCLSGLSASGSFAACPYSLRVVGPGTYNISIQNQSGTSNSLSFTVTSGAVTPPAAASGPSIAYLSVSSGPVGTLVTVTGSGFDSKNYVLLDSNMTGSSIDAGGGNTLTFVIPSVISPQCNLFAPTGRYCALAARKVTPDSYTVSVINQSGTSNSLSFTVTGTTDAIQTGGVPAISTIYPSSGTPATAVVIRGSGFTVSGNKILFGGAKVPSIYVASGYTPSSFGFGVQGSAGSYYDFSSPDGTTLSFTVPSSRHDNCNDTFTACSNVYYPPYNGDSYTIQVVNANGTSNSVNFGFSAASTAQ